MKGRPKNEMTYENLLKYYNSDLERTTCECGKIVSTNMYEKHLKTKLHTTLLYYKNRFSNNIEIVNQTGF
jgi:hypothetical protein